VLAELIEHVVPTRVGFGKYSVEIFWTPLVEALRQAVDSTAHLAAAQERLPQPARAA
jgi:hypothetical protein